MLDSYFRFKDKHYKTLESLKDNLNSEENNLFTVKKIKKLNDYQFFYLLSHLMYHHPIEHFTLDTLELFFETKKIILNDNDYDDDYLPFQDFDKNYTPVLPITTFHHYVTHNFAEGVGSLANYYLSTKKYSKKIWLTKLFILSDKIIEDIHQQVSTVKYYFRRYIENEENPDNYLKVNHSMEIVVALENYEIVLQQLYKRIHEKISTLSSSISKTGNYNLNTNDEILEKFYFRLEKFMFIDQNKTTLNQFIEVLKLDWQSHNSIIHFQMDNIQFRYFINRINQFFKTNISMTSMFYSGNIETKNGKINPSAIYTSASKSIIKLPKKHKLIESIFENL